MILLLISAVLIVISVQIFAFSYSYQGLNKAIINMPIAILFQDVETTLGGASVKVSDAKNHILNYYEKSLPRYCKNYETLFYCYNSEDGSMCLSEYCDGLEVTVNATLNLNYTYHRVMFYELRRGVING